MKQFGAALVTAFTILALCFAAGVITTGRIVYILLAIMAISLAYSIGNDINKISNDNNQEQ